MIPVRALPCYRYFGTGLNMCCVQDWSLLVNRNWPNGWPVMNPNTSSVLCLDIVLMVFLSWLGCAYGHLFHLYQGCFYGGHTFATCCAVAASTVDTSTYVVPATKQSVSDSLCRTVIATCKTCDTHV
jgi:hypothetical protein